MHILEPAHFEAVRAKRQAKERSIHRRKKFKFVTVVLLLAMLINTGLYLRPLHSVAAKTFVPLIPTVQPNLIWPAFGQSAIGSLSQGVQSETSGQKPIPMASIAKVMLVVEVLKKKPLTSGESGPLIPITETDIEIYNKYVENDGSVIKVNLGEKINEYQALQAVLTQSASNMADTLAIWAYGSMQEYHISANKDSLKLGMSRTTFAGDASGFSPESTSTAHDLVILGQAALTNPVIKGIVAQKNSEIPLLGTVMNSNYLLGYGGIIGIKTGNSDQAGGCYLFAATRKIFNQEITVVGANIGSPTLIQAMNVSLTLLDSYFAGFEEEVIIPKGAVVARYTAPWPANTTAVTAMDTSVLSWRGSKMVVKIEVNPIKSNSAAGNRVGTLFIQSPYAKTITPISLSKTLAPPTSKWRFTRY
ncbi:MAG: hypothetical protein WCJ24_01975 [Candidatus Saccharibacteria bacterium]